MNGRGTLFTYLCVSSSVLALSVCTLLLEMYSMCAHLLITSSNTQHGCVERFDVAICNDGIMFTLSLSGRLVHMYEAKHLTLAEGRV